VPSFSCSRCGASVRTELIGWKPETGMFVLTLASPCGHAGTIGASSQQVPTAAVAGAVGQPHREGAVTMNAR
jgi:hypothetical protein